MTESVRSTQPCSKLVGSRIQIKVKIGSSSYWKRRVKGLRIACSRAHVWSIFQMYRCEDGRVPKALAYIGANSSPSSSTPRILLYNGPFPYVSHFTLLFCLHTYRTRNGVPIGAVVVMLALVTSMGGFMPGYDTTHISEILVMDDFKLRFATCSNPTDPNTCTCEFSTARAGLIVSCFPSAPLLVLF